MYRKIWIMNLNPQSRLKIIKSIEKLKRFSKYMGE